MNGAVFVDKPSGMTSFSLTNRVRRLLGAKKAGHTGTLDPMATGVCVVMLGSSARFIEYLPTHDKAYIARIKLGVTTDTLDTEGRVLSEKPVTAGREDFEKALKKFTGNILQVPPMYSALKVEGKKLYELARQGIEIERTARPVTISKAEILSFDEEKNVYEIEVCCSAGTYIRSLARDIGEELGCGAVLTSLRRTMANGITLDRCVTLENLSEKDVHPADALLTLPTVYVSEAQAKRFSCGGELDCGRTGGDRAPGLKKVICGKSFIGVGEIDHDGVSLFPKKISVD